MMKTAASLAMLASVAAASPLLQERAQCNHDNLLRCLLATPTLATPYCISYLGLPTPVTVTGTTVTPVVTSVITEGVTSTLVPRADAVTPAQCLASTYPASRVSSACSCLSIPATVSLTATAPAMTTTAIKCLQTQAVVNGDFEHPDTGLPWEFSDSPSGNSGVSTGIPNDANHFAFIGQENDDSAVGTTSTHSVSQTVALCPDSTYNLTFHHRFHMEAPVSCSVDVTLGSLNLFHYDFPSADSGDFFMDFASQFVPGFSSGKFAFTVSCKRVSAGTSSNYINVDDISLATA